MKRKKLNQQFENVLKSARRLADLESATAIIVLADVAFNFKTMKKMLRGIRLIVAAEEPHVQEAVKADEISLISLEHEPQTRGTQVSQMLLATSSSRCIRRTKKIAATRSV